MLLSVCLNQGIPASSGMQPIQFASHCLTQDSNSVKMRGQKSVPLLATFELASARAAPKVPREEKQRDPCGFAFSVLMVHILNLSPNVDISPKQIPQAPRHARALVITIKQDPNGLEKVLSHPVCQRVRLET